MARTDPTTVKSIMQTGLGDPEINALINIANPIVTRVVGGEGMTDAVLKDIETYLTAHLIAIGKERQPREERVGDIWVKYQENPKGWLESTTFGQTVIFLDESGNLARRSLKKARIRAIEQIKE